MKDGAKVAAELATAMQAGGGREERLARAAGIIRRAGDYRWVGLYDVLEQEIAVVAWDGPAEPAFPRFPISQGLCGEAVRLGSPVLVSDVSKDPRYLTTFGSTRSEIVVPIRKGPRDRAIGTLDVESQEIGAFGDSDRVFLERCASELARLGF